MSLGEFLTIVVALCTFGLAALTVRFFVVASSSMEPTLRFGDRVLVVRRSHIGRTLGRGHIVVARDPASDARRHLVKRIVATAGDQVALVHGTVQLNGDSVREPYLGAAAVGPNFDPLLVPDGCVFVLGDDRRLARDSRDFGPLPFDLIVGRAVMVVLPPTRARRL